MTCAAHFLVGRRAGVRDEPRSSGLLGLGLRSRHLSGAVLSPASHGARASWADSQALSSGTARELPVLNAIIFVMFTVSAPIYQQEIEVSEEKERWATEAPKRGTEGGDGSQPADERPEAGAAEGDGS